MLKDNLGVEVSIAQTEVAAFTTTSTGASCKCGTAADHGLSRPEDIIDLLFHSKSRKNETRYDNATFDGIVEQARTEQDAKRLENVSGRREDPGQRGGLIPLYFGKDRFVAKPTSRATPRCQSSSLPQIPEDREVRALAVECAGRAKPVYYLKLVTC
jgi:hypothetical protein